MESMTGFGQGHATGAPGTVRIQITSVNNRACQVSLKSDLGDPALDDEVRQTTRQTLGRGTITVAIHAVPNGGGFDEAGLRDAWTRLKALADALGAPAPTLDEAARLALPHATATAWAEPARSALTQALTAVQASRRREGAALGVALLAQAARLRDLRNAMAARAAVRQDAYRLALTARIAEAIGTQVPAEVLVREIAVYAERIDVTEELVRLATHLDALDALLASPDDIGRRLEFLAQELGREVNTTGAKANDAPLAALVIEAKVAVDAIKEQAANLA